MVIQKNSKKGNIIRYNRNNGNNGNISMFGGGPLANQQFELNQSHDIAINNAGFVFVADTENHCIRIFSPNPDFTLIYNIGSPGQGGNTNDRLRYPSTLAIDDDILYVADTSNHRIQVFRININEADNTITATHITSRLGNPHSIGTGRQGNTRDEFRYPNGIAIDNDILYVADTNNHRIQVFRITINDNNTITTTHIPRSIGSQRSIGSTGIPDNTNYNFNGPFGLAIENNILYVADVRNHRIQMFRITINDNNTITKLHLRSANDGRHSIGTGIIGYTNYTFSYPYRLLIKNDILYVADAANHRIQVFRITINDNNIISATHLPGRNHSPHSIGTGRLGNTTDTFQDPTGLAIHRHNNEDILYVADTWNNRIQVFNGDLTNPATLQYYDTIPSPPPRYTILKQNRMIPLQIRNTRCMFCNFNVCTPTYYNHNNNVNGYVVKLDTAQPSYFHYTCIYNYIISHNAVDISQVGCRVNKHDMARLITRSLDNNNFNGTDFFSPDFKMLRREIDVPLNIRDTPCRLCRFPLCARVIDTTNNLNGYVIHLHNLTNPNAYYYHYKCISKYFIQISETDSPYKSPHCATVLDRDDIDKLLNIDGKVDAVNGNGFY